MTQPGRGGTPRRVKVTSPRRTAARYQRRSRYVDLDEGTSLGEVYVDSLLRAQRRLSFALVVTVGVVVIGLPALLLVMPDVHDVTILSTIPIVWLTLGVLVYPAALAATLWYVRAAERVEREFVELMDLP